MHKAVPTDPAEGEEHTMAIFSLFTVQSWAAGRAPEHPKSQCPHWQIPQPWEALEAWQVWDLCRVTLLFVWGRHVATKGRKTFFLFKQT